jgi:ERCC4-related helicase
MIFIPKFVIHWTLSFLLLVRSLLSVLTPGNASFFLSTDEAHRATGDYAYNQVVRFLMAKNPHFRVLALTATPGNNPEAVQLLIDGLHISRIEIRDEDSLDLKQYIHKKVDPFRTVEGLTSNIARSSKNTLSNQMKTLRQSKSCCAKRWTFVEPFTFSP